ncbi:MAG TPA: hypothetical protein VHI78_06430 [Bacteroidales bacterium]|nr:hypothetical protein [Bacteroidales bacterium]
MRTIFSLLVILLVLGLGSCKKDSKDPAACSGAWATEVEAEADAVSDAMSAYLADMSVANCNAFKDAYLDYIDALEPFLECETLTAQDREQVQEYIDASEAAMSALTCE